MGSMWGWIGRRRQLEIIEMSLNHINKIIEVSNELSEFLETYVTKGKEEASKVYEKIFLSEKEADDIKRDIISSLSTGIFHPIDREDLIRLTLTSDDIAAHAKYAARNLLILPQREIPKELGDLLIKMSKELQKATIRIKDGINELYRDPRKALEVADTIERIEEEVDEIRTEALEKAVAWCDTIGIPSVCIIIKEVIDSIENATDKCEDVADIIRSIALLSF